MTASREELQALCAQDVMHWQTQPLDMHGYGRQLQRLNRERPSLFIFRFDAGEVRVQEKPASDEAAALGASRVPLYQRFLAEVARHFLPDLVLDVGIDLADCAVGDDQIPLLSFQKLAGDRLLLLPDIDFLLHRFYAAPELMDSVPPQAKRDQAVFVGSTTGVDAQTRRIVSHTLESVQALSTERLRAGQYFQGHPDVVFRLPVIVQCATAEAEDRLRALDFCGGPSMPWSAQYGYRYLLSMDGNGATCSRVALALRSNSLLLKYRSEAVLHYFKAMVPWTHYIPVEQDACVHAAIGLGRSHPELVAQIVRNAQAFHDHYLSWPVLSRYAAVVIGELAGLLEPGRRERAPGMRRVGGALAKAHVAGVGDIMCSTPGSPMGQPGSGRAIEAFSISLDGPGLRDGQLAYQSMDAVGHCSPWSRGGVETGSRGESRPLAGFRIACAEDGPPVRYRATFAGGFSCDWVASPGWCIHPSRAALESFEVDVPAAADPGPSAHSFLPTVRAPG